MGRTINLLQELSINIYGCYNKSGGKENQRNR